MKIEVFYQKITSNEGVFAYEALARFSEGGIYLPTDKVIHQFEEKNTFRDVGLLIFNQIIEDLKNNPEIPYIFMNLTPSQLSNTKDITYMIACLKENKLDGRFGFEITEDYIDFDNPSVNESISIIKSSKALLLIDDFGVKSASIDRLFLPIDIVKIDRIYLEEDKKEILRSIVLMSKIINKMVLIEGVETKNDLAIAKSLDINYYQGYYFHKPGKFF